MISIHIQQLGQLPALIGDEAARSFIGVGALSHLIALEGGLYALRHNYEPQWHFLTLEELPAYISTLPRRPMWVPPPPTRHAALGADFLASLGL